MHGELTGREILAFGLGCLVALAAFNNGVAQARMVPSGSMEPTLNVGDRILVMWRQSPVRPGDVLVFRPPFKHLPGGEVATSAGPYLTIGDEDTYVKRCVGLPGDLIEVRRNDGLYRNGVRVDEPYVREKPRYQWGPDRVPKDHLFMLGDNRNDSFDSHYWGFLPTKNVTGRPTAVIWPPQRLRHF